jgi:hypothetical protein
MGREVPVLCDAHSIGATAIELVLMIRWQRPDSDGAVMGPLKPDETISGSISVLCQTSLSGRWRLTYLFELEV